VQRQTYAIGIKELWKFRRADRTGLYSYDGWPLGVEHYGGGWLYAMPEGFRILRARFPLWIIHDVNFDPHVSFSAFTKTDPFIRQILEGGRS